MTVAEKIRRTGRRLSDVSLRLFGSGLGRFAGDIRGNYAMMTVIALLPIMGGLAIAVDLAEMNRQRQTTFNALDAAALATARHVVSGASDAELIAYATNFFHANLGSVDPADTTLHVVLPSNVSGGGTLKLSADLRYSPHFFPAFETLLGKTADQMSGDIDFSARTEVRLKNTLEVALVLDNSGSMDFEGEGSGQKRIDLLETAAKQLVDTLAEQAAMIKQVEKPVQFALVPFAASVNVGPDKDNAAWMDTGGISPVHHENFDWSTLDAPDKFAEQVGAAWYKRGDGWGSSKDQPLTRFSLYGDMTKIVSRERVEGSRHYVCYDYRRDGTCDEGGYEYDYNETPGPFASWQGCIEARPSPYNTSDAPASSSDPASLFVPMFAPDEAGDRWRIDPNDEDEPSPKSFDAYNNWWNDGYPYTHEDYDSVSAAVRQKNMRKYFEVRPYHAPTPKSGSGPNQSCTTKPITPLTDVTTPEGLAAIKSAIDAMEPIGGTNVPEGMAWGWRAVSSGAPFTEGRPDGERGNDKVVIVLTDGENTYYTPNSLGASDRAGNKSTYSSYGYLYPGYNGTGTGRLFTGTSSAIGHYDYTNGNYTNAMNEHMATLCTNAKAAGLLVMTVALDLDSGNSAQAKQIEALKKCSSDSRFRKDPDDPTKPDKLFWNTNGGELEETFRKIADELSNLRIVG